MKRPMTLHLLVFFLALACFACEPGTVHAQQSSTAQGASAEDSAIRKLIESKRFDFVAQSASATRGGTRQLTSYYSLRIKGDTVQAYLPYFGRSYSATLGTESGPIDFSTKDFDYSITEGKKGGWNIKIIPSNVNNVRQMLLNVSSSGYANLQVTSNFRDMISFYGIVQHIK